MSPAALMRGALGLWVCLLAACQTPPPVPPTHAEIVREPLTRILAAQHPPCGTVHRYSRQDRLDYRVERASGELFRVCVSGSGHVLIAPAAALQ